MIDTGIGVVGALRPGLQSTKLIAVMHINVPSAYPFCAVQDVAKAGQIVPAVTIAWLLASAGTAALYGLVWLFSSCFHIASRKTSRKTTKTTKPRSPLISSLLWPLLGMIFGYDLFSIPDLRSSFFMWADKIGCSFGQLCADLVAKPHWLPGSVWLGHQALMSARVLCGAPALCTCALSGATLDQVTSIHAASLLLACLLH